MRLNALGLFFALLSLPVAYLYSLRAYSFTATLLNARGKKLPAQISICAAHCLLAAMALFFYLPPLLVFLITFLAVLMELFFFFQSRPAVMVFAAGTFLFLLMNVHMLLFGILTSTYHIRTLEDYREKGLYSLHIFLALLSAEVFLEIFRRLIQKEAIQQLIDNNSQLYFVTMSLTLIDAYLLVLSISYTNASFTGMQHTFHIVTSLLLFGAFYTSFKHGVRMSILEGYEKKSRSLEKQLVKTHENLNQLQKDVYMDPLTGVHNRRYGIQAIEQLIQAGGLFSICLLDLDRLKYVNDNFGHSQGDRYLLTVTRMLALLFGDAYISRLGGDEFLLLAPGQDEAALLELLLKAEGRIREKAALDGLPFSPSFSYGVVGRQGGEELNAGELLNEADRKMYLMKRARHMSRQD